MKRLVRKIRINLTSIKATVNQLRRNSRRTEIADVGFSIYNIELTNRCPMRCIMCPRTKHMTRKQGFMDVNLFKKIIDEYISCSPAASKKEVLWLHHFGESLLHPEFDTCMQYAISHEVPACISVNPIMLSANVGSRLLAAHPHIVFISLDGHDEQSFAAIRGVENGYKKSRENLLSFLHQKKVSAPKTKVILSMIVFPQNIPSIEAVKKELAILDGVDEFVTKPFIRWDGSAAEISSLEPALRKKFIPEYRVCNIPWTKTTITWDGDVVPCCYDYNKKVILGSVAQSSLHDIWNGPAYRKFRCQHLTGKDVNPLCRTCDNFYLQRYPANIAAACIFNVFEGIRKKIHG